MFASAIAISGVVGGPLSGWLMQKMPGVYGLAGWQWMFIVEAIPSLVLGFLTIAFLQDRVHDAKWLTEAERRLVATQVAAEEEDKSDAPLGKTFSDPRLWICALIYFCVVMGLYGVGFWLPNIIKSTGVTSTLEIGALSAVPYAVAAVVMVLVGRSADRLRERRWHLAVPGVLGAIGLFASTLYAQNTGLSLIALTVGTAGILTMIPMFWGLPTAFLGGTAAAAGIALINSLGNLAGFVSPFMVGWLKDLTHSTNSGMYMLTGALLLGAVLTFSMPARLVNK